MTEDDDKDGKTRDDPPRAVSTDWMNERVRFELPRWVLIAGGILLLVLIVY